MYSLSLVLHIKEQESYITLTNAFKINMIILQLLIMHFCCCFKNSHCTTIV